MTTPPQTATPCIKQNADAVIFKAPVTMPDSAREQGIKNAEVLIAVTIGEDGVPTKISIYRSALKMAIDQTAMQAARQSRYSPKIVDCKPVVDTMVVPFDFYN